MVGFRKIKGPNLGYLKSGRKWPKFFLKKHADNAVSACFLVVYCFYYRRVK